MICNYRYSGVKIAGILIGQSIPVTAIPVTKCLFVRKYNAIKFA